MKKRIRAANVEALIREIERYRELLRDGRTIKGPPPQRRGGKSAK
jgi:hypothetical protein